MGEARSLLAGSRDNRTLDIPTMTDSVACANCGTLLGEDKNAAADKRIPCPKCGSKSRTFSVTLSSRLTATASVSAVIVASAASLILQTVVVPAGTLTRDCLSKPLLSLGST